VGQERPWREAALEPLSKRNTALLIVDVQVGLDEMEAAGQRRNNPRALERVAELLALFRAEGAPVFHVRDAPLNPKSRFNEANPGFQAKAEARELPGEPVVIKRVSSGFVGTDLEERLRRAEVENLVIAGATTNQCVETTARMAGNLGFRTSLVRDATWAFERYGLDGEHFPAELVHAMALANLRGEFAQIVTTADVVGGLKGD